MCGRFNLTAPGELIAEEFGLDETPLLTPRFNIAPSQPVATIRLEPATSRRGLALARWGFALETRAEPERADPQGVLFPGLSGPVTGERRQINARSETAARSPALRDAFARRRCLIPATGFYEWRRTPSARPEPWLFRLASGRTFAFAGLWEPARVSGGAASCLILTTEPNELTREIHDRMPAILTPEDYAAWLDPATTKAAQLQPLLRPLPAQALIAFPVGSAVNSPATDDPSCVEPLPHDRG